MKGNNGEGNNPERDVWETPGWIFDSLNKQYGFKFDCCASEENKKCDGWHDDFLKVDTEEAGLNDDEICWMNPPFSKAFEMFEHFFKVAPSGVCIYRCDNMESKVWQEIILKNCSWILIPNKRVAYEWKGNKQSSPRFPSALIGFNLELPKGIKGILLKPMEETWPLQ